MKFKQQSSNPILCKGFTLLELLVAMSVTVILLGMVTFMTGVSLEGYGNSRDKVVTSREAKQALDAITRDFQAMVSRRDGNDYEWLHAQLEPKIATALGGPTDKRISNACRVIFFTGAPDRYDGDITGGSGDVSAVSYRLVYRDQISGTAATSVGAFPTFTLYRHLVDPDDTFTNVLGQSNLTSPVSPAVNQFTDALDFTAENVLAENIYELSMTFIVEYTNASGVTKLERVTIGSTAGAQYSSFRMKGNGIVAAGGTNAALLGDGQLVGVEISITVLSDKGLVMTQKGGMTRGDIINEYGYHYTNLISVPRP